MFEELSIRRHCRLKISRAFCTHHKLRPSSLGKPSQLWASTSVASPDRSVSKKALLIAINYSDLTSPCKEVEMLKSLLIRKYQYTESSIILLTDEECTPKYLYPNKTNIMREIKDFLNDQQRGDQFFFYFAGHSSQVISDDEGEEDGKDEVMLPVDAYKPGGAVDYDQAIFDDYLYKHLIDALKPKCRLTAILDTCHSGTLLDLPHHRCNRVCELTSLFRRAARRSLEQFNKYSTLLIIKQFLPEAQRGEGTNKATKMTKYMFTTKERIGLCSGFCLRLKNNRNNVVCISACKDSEETLEGAKYPTMTKALCDLLENEQHPTLKKVMRELTDRIHTTRIHDHSTSQPLPGVSKEGKPQISGRYPLRMNSVLKI